MFPRPPSLPAAGPAAQPLDLAAVRASSLAGLARRFSRSGVASRARTRRSTSESISAAFRVTWPPYGHLYRNCDAPPGGALLCDQTEWSQTPHRYRPDSRCLRRVPYLRHQCGHWRVWDEANGGFAVLVASAFFGLGVRSRVPGAPMPVCPARLAGLLISGDPAGPLTTPAITGRLAGTAG